jgi:hypothetical protein
MWRWSRCLGLLRVSCVPASHLPTFHTIDPPLPQLQGRVAKKRAKSGGNKGGDEE